MIIFTLSFIYNISIKVNHFIYNNIINLFSENKLKKNNNDKSSFLNNNFITNEVYLNKNILLLILNIYKTKNLLLMLEKNENYYNNNKLLLNFNKIKNYHLEIKNILYMNSKEKFKITKTTNFNLLSIEKNYKLSNTDLNFSKLYTITESLFNINSTNFLYQKIFLNNTKKKHRIW
jgi:hypothetical protein